ncbi:MAG: cell envelope-related transcriptional attenuator [Candidatus Peregrinibacteria bacterium Greene0416_19]|nr:MAG: cell envelope-related transcriptional attenuator [Candidatus Peregrinibacteria bacterium Greene0416_19]
MSAFTTRRIREEDPGRDRAERGGWRGAGGVVRSSRTRAVALLVRTVLLSKRIGLLLRGWYRGWKARQEANGRTQRLRRILRRILFILLGILLALLVLAGTVKALVSSGFLGIHTLFSVAGKELPTDEDGYTNFLLLGRGDASHEGPDLTDTIIIASLDPWKTRSAVLLSVPRDLFIADSRTITRGRINEFYRDYKGYLRRKEGQSEEEASRNAMRFLADEIGDRLHLPIHHVLMVDFMAFEQAVDALGGVDIDVPYDIMDTEYPGPDYTYQTFSIKAGRQHLDGATALQYARSRHTTSDFGRSARQQQLITALGEQARETGLLGSPSRITQFTRILAEHTDMTMDFGELLGAAKLGKRIDQSRVISMQLNNENGYDISLVSPGGFLYNPPRDQFDGASVLLPISIPEYPVTWKQLQAFAILLFKMRTIHLSHPQIYVYNAGAQSGLGRLLATELTRYGLAPAETANFPTAEKRDTSVVIARTEADKPVALFFSSLFRLPLELLDPASPLMQDLGQVTIVLGKDYVYQPIQNLLLSP